MKNIIILFLLSVIFYSCNRTSNKNKPIKSIMEVNYELADEYLESDIEKIGLLSVSINIPIEKSYSVLRDYIAKTHNIKEMKNPDYYVKVVDTIAINNNLSKKITASIIFSYKYEMITRNEIIYDYIEENENNDDEKPIEPVL